MNTPFLIKHLNIIKPTQPDEETTLRKKENNKY